MKKVIIGLTLLQCSCFAALAPLPQSIREINAIVNYPELPELLVAPSAIKEITKTEDGYLIITSSHVLKVTVEYSKEKRVGPRKFSLKFGPAMPVLLDKKKKCDE